MRLAVAVIAALSASACGSNVLTTIRRPMETKHPIMLHSPSATPSAASSARPNPVFLAKPKVKIKEVTLPLKFNCSIKYNNVSDTVSSIWKQDIPEAFNTWNLALGYNVFEIDSEDVNAVKLEINVFNYKYNDGRAWVAGDYQPSCTEPKIRFFKVSSNQRTVALHELGHALGLDHSDDPYDIMYSVTSVARTLSADNISRAKKSIYEYCPRKTISFEYGE